MDREAIGNLTGSPVVNVNVEPVSMDDIADEVLGSLSAEDRATLRDLLERAS